MIITLIVINNNNKYVFVRPEIARGTVGSDDDDATLERGAAAASILAGNSTRTEPCVNEFQKHRRSPSVYKCVSYGRLVIRCMCVCSIRIRYCLTDFVFFLCKSSALARKPNTIYKLIRF